MDAIVSVKNYRCFPDDTPVQIALRNGFTTFVGVNNSGKSSLLRFFYEFRRWFEVLAHAPSLAEWLAMPQAFSPQLLPDPNEVFHRHNKRDLTFEFKLTPYPEGDTQPRVKVVLSRDTRLATLSVFANGGFYNGRTQVLGDNVLAVPGGARIPVSSICDIASDLSRTLYIGPFRNAINVGTNSSYFDIEVGDALIKRWSSFKAGSVLSHRQAAHRLSSELKAIFGFQEFDITTSDTRDTLYLQIDGESMGLTEVGSGISQFIMVLLNAALKQPSWILIDEPELNLHPSLQLDFLTTLGSYANRGVVFSTHSIGLARAAADAIYSVSQNGRFRSTVKKYEDTPHLSEFLGELSFSGYRELGFTRILLVEGTSDVRTFQQFLRMHKRDHQILILPLGGGSLVNGSVEVELNEVCRISNDVWAIIDRDTISEDSPLAKDRKAFMDICKNVGINCSVLRRRATENYLAEHAIRTVKGDKYRALDRFERLEDSEVPWSKSENWRIAREMTLADLSGNDLGEFLTELCDLREREPDEVSRA